MIKRIAGILFLITAAGIISLAVVDSLKELYLAIYKKSYEAGFHDGNSYFERYDVRVSCRTDLNHIDIIIHNRGE